MCENLAGRTVTEHGRVRGGSFVALFPSVNKV
jgi:hypothetical protein